MGAVEGLSAVSLAMALSALTRDFKLAMTMADHGDAQLSFSQKGVLSHAAAGARSAVASVEPPETMARRSSCLRVALVSERQDEQWVRESCDSKSTMASAFASFDTAFLILDRAESLDSWNMVTYACKAAC